MTTHNLQDEPESTIGSKPEPRREQKSVPGPHTHTREEEERIRHGARIRSEEGDETEDGSEIRDRDEPVETLLI